MRLTENINAPKTNVIPPCDVINSPFVGGALLFKGMKMVCGIYSIQSKIKPERIYVGSTVSINTRWRKHITDLMVQKHHSIKLQLHYNKHGIDDLVFSVIEECDLCELIYKEQYWIDLVRPYFNSTLIAGKGCCRGRKSTPEQRIRLSAAKKGKKHPRVYDAEELEKRRIKMLGNKLFGGRKHTLDTIEKMRFAKMSTIMTKRPFRYFKETLRNYFRSEEERLLMKDYYIRLKKRPRGAMSEETKLKLSECHKGKKMTPENIEKLRARMLGSKFAPCDDKRKETLRIGVFKALSKKTPYSKSGYWGVSAIPIKKGGGFKVSLRHNGKQKYLGTYRTAEEAAKVHDDMAKECFGKIALLNFPVIEP